MARRAVLHAEVRPAPETRSSPEPGTRGVTRTALRPVGRVEIAGDTHEALAEGGFIESGRAVQVTGREGGSLRVREVPE